MSLEVWEAPPQQRSIPWIEGMLPGQEEQELAYTKAQRQWYLEAFNHQCHFPYYSEEGGFGKCYVRGDTNLQIHHILPSSWQSVWQPMTDPNTTLGIALCSHHHNDVIHPEIGEALRQYHQDPTAIQRAIQWHRDEARAGRPFWNTEYDDMMTEVAQRAVDTMRKPYPVDKSWGKKEHHPRKGWAFGLF